MDGITKVNSDAAILIQLIDEKQSIENMIADTEAFFVKCPDLDFFTKALINNQITYMKLYSNCLNQRLVRLNYLEGKTYQLD